MSKYLFIFLLTFTLFRCVAQNKRINLEKIIFHTSYLKSLCFGGCPTYHLQIDKEKNAKLYAEEVYIDDYSLSPQKDTARIGYFIGNLSDYEFIKLTNELQEVGLDSLKFDGGTCCDAALITIIVYYNGERKYLKSMFPPDKADNLISILYEICEKSKLQKTKERFLLED